jgi:hypothetical protein
LGFITHILSKGEPEFDPGSPPRTESGRRLARHKATGRARRHELKGGWASGTGTLERCQSVDAVDLAHVVDTIELGAGP